VTGNRFDRLPRIAHGKGVTNKLQHFRIVTAVADGYALLRGDVPALPGNLFSSAGAVP
jgi:hypothetical protein